jgi:uncharacterized protein
VIRVLLLGVLLLLLARAFWRLVDGLIEVSGGLPPGRHRGRAQTAPVTLARDPVCGTHVPTASALSARAGGGTHYFCSERCRAKFLTQHQAG